MHLATSDRRTEANAQDITFEIARTREDFESSLRLLYEAYVRSGLAVRNPLGIRVTPYHLLDTTDVLVAKSQGEVFMTYSMIGDGQLGLPMEAMYGDTIEELRSRGKRVAEVGCFADRRIDGIRFSPVFNALTKLLVQTARHRGLDALVAAMHPRHANFYRRLLGFEDLAGLAYCQYVSNRPAVALLLDVTKKSGTKLYNALAEDPYPVAALQARAFDPDTVRYFQSLLDVTLIQFNNAELDSFDRASNDQQSTADQAQHSEALSGNARE